MKIQIEHDNDGNIRTIGVPVAGSKVQTHLRPSPGWKISEVESPVEIRDHRADAHRLRDIRQQFVVKDAKLVRRSQ